MPAAARGARTRASRTPSGLKPLTFVILALWLVQALALLTRADADGSNVAAGPSPAATAAPLPTTTVPRPGIPGTTVTAPAAGPSQAPPTTAVPGGGPTTTLPAPPTQPPRPPAYRQTGSVQTIAVDDPTCTAAECDGVLVQCPGLAPVRGVLGIDPAEGTARGVILLLSGGSGTYWWDVDGNGGREAVSQLRQGGLDVIQLRWIDPWMAAPEGQPLGPATMACRPATVITWVYEHHAQGRPLASGTGVCGFCVSGHSAGASALAYSMSFYGVAAPIKAAIFTSGPPHAAMEKGCLPAQGTQSYVYEPTSAQTIDGNYGYDRSGPCLRHDPSMAERWTEDSADIGGVVYSFPSTRIVMILGGQDTVVPEHAMDYLARLEQAQTPMVREETVPSMGHTVVGSRDGRAALIRAVFETG